MITRLATTSLALLLFCGTAQADKFYFASKDGEKKAQGNAQNFIEGVLVKETKTTYVIRVAHGTIEVDKYSVVRVERDGLTVADLDKRAKDSAKQAAEADNRRQQVQAAEAAARRSNRDATETERPKEQVLVIEIDFKGLLPGYTFKTGFDPVIGRMNLAGLRQVVEAWLRREAKKAAHRKVD